jgi:hypothetical protein
MLAPYEETRHRVAQALSDVDCLPAISGSDPTEAMIWVERRWDVYGKAELAARVVDRYCGLRVVRWHLFCASGE